MSQLKKHNAEEYLDALVGLLPQGVAWSREPGSRLGLLLQASADELARIDATASTLLDEVNPLTAINGLEDWERVLGLPDACLPAGTTLQERRSAVDPLWDQACLAELRHYTERSTPTKGAIIAALVTIVLTAPILGLQLKLEGYQVVLEQHWRPVWIATAVVFVFQLIKPLLLRSKRSISTDVVNIC